MEVLPHEGLSPLFLAAVEAVEEAILDSLLQARTVTGFKGRTVEMIPVDRLEALIQQHRRD